jgi:two-component sensor histidine kinase
MRIPARDIARRALVIWTGWTLYALFASSQNYFSRAYSTRMPWKPAFQYALVDSYAWAVLTPLVFLVAAKLGIRRGNWWWTVPLQLCASVLFALAHVLVFVRLLPWIGYHVSASMIQSLFVAKLNPDLLACWVLMGIRHGIEYYRGYQARELKASQLEAKLVQAQLQVLKMQLQPHFLFNTLHAISALLYKDVEMADRMIARLSDFLRMTLDSAGEEQVTLKRELEFMDKYIEIEQMRFGERLRVRRDIDPDTLDFMVPNLMMQPLVENAVRHSIAQRSSGGTIELRARQVGAMLSIGIHDDGPGAGEELREGVGLSNTRARLVQLYGNRHRFETGNDAGGGFRVAIEIPVQ